MTMNLHRGAYAIVFFIIAIACGPSNQTSSLSENEPSKDAAATTDLCALAGIPASVQGRVPGQGLAWISFEKEKQAVSAAGTECVVLYRANIDGNNHLLANYYKSAGEYAVLTKSTGVDLTKPIIEQQANKGATPEKASTDDCPSEC